MQKSIIIENKSYEYQFPSQVREIPLKSISNRGFMPALKSHLQGRILTYESLLEHDFLLLLNHDPNCIDLQPQPIEISYSLNPAKKELIYPDCWAIFKDGREFLFEIKTESQYQKLIQDESWELKTQAILDFCEKKNWTYQVITNKKIRCTRLNNIKDTLTAAKHYSPTNIAKDLGTFHSSIRRFLKNDHLNLRSLAELLSVTINSLPLEEIVSLLKYKIYFLHLFINWNEPLEDTLIFLDKIDPIPVYDLPDNPLSNEDNGYPIIISINNDKTTKSSLKNQKVYEKRLQLISPLIDNYGKEGVKSQVRQFCKDNNLPFQTTYRYFKIWKYQGKEGLCPNALRKHIQSHIDPKVDSLLQEAIINWNQGEWTQIRAAYNEFCISCQKLGLKPASYQIFRLRIKSLPSVERQGKFKPAKQAFIKKGLTDTYKEGRTPGSVIQMDHTKLDIWLIDKFTKQPYARPWLTLGIDAFSRSIWGFFLSFDAPSQESVTQTILMGLVQKDKLRDWKVFESQLLKNGQDPHQYKLPCAGFPARIQVDNSREFMAESVNHLCMKLNITLEFRPIKRPEFGGFIESVWDTINDGIRNAKLPGRIFSLPKSREASSSPKITSPPGYNGQQEAALTLDQFREWLFSFFVLTYSSEKRAGQFQSPNEKWTDGLKGNNQLPMGGALYILNPSEYQTLDYESKITVQSRLSQRGFRYKNLYYSSEWLNEARKSKLLIDGKNYEFKISHWDIRYILIINPNNNGVEILRAYKYAGDDRITQFIQMGLGNIPGYQSFPISLNMINYANQILNMSNNNYDSKLLIIDDISQKLQKKAKLNKRERQFLEKTTTEELDFTGVFSKNGKDAKAPNVPKKQTSTKKKMLTFPTDREEAKKEMLYWKLFELGGEE